MGKAALILKNVADVINCWWTSSHMAFLRKMYSHVIQSKERCIILVIKIFKRDTHTERKDSVKDSFSQSLYISYVFRLLQMFVCWSDKLTEHKGIYANVLF